MKQALGNTYQNLTHQTGPGEYLPEFCRIKIGPGEYLQEFDASKIGPGEYLPELCRTSTPKIS